MDWDVETLSRIQFALTIMFHYLFPPLSIGLSVLMVCMEAAYLRTRDRQYEVLAKFWTGIFAVNFAMGVATGIVMEFQFGTNWSRYARYVGDVFGSALAAEGIFAFFLESGFLAVLVFGWDRVSSRTHFVATLMVAFGSIFSAVWIIIANSWQQTPAGHHIVKHGEFLRAEVKDFWAVIFNPSSMDRLAHVLLGSLLQGAFFVMSVSAYYLLRGRHVDLARKGFTLALFVAAAAAVVMPFSGHRQARIVAVHQPAKLAAMEGYWKAPKQTGSRLILFGLYNPWTKRVDYAVAIPDLLSLLVYGDPNRPVTAMEAFHPSHQPPVAIPFYCFHLMVWLGILFMVLTLLALYFYLNESLFQKRWLLALFVGAVVGPYVANQAGWVTAEVGRQPWLVYGELKTSEGYSATLETSQVLASMILFLVLYALLFTVWLYVLNRKIHEGPEERLRMPAQTNPEALLDAAARLANPAGYSMTLAKDPAGQTPQ